MGLKSLKQPSSGKLKSKQPFTCKLCNLFQRILVEGTSVRMRFCQLCDQMLTAQFVYAQIPALHLNDRTELKCFQKYISMHNSTPELAFSSEYSAEIKMYSVMFTRKRFHFADRLK